LRRFWSTLLAAGTLLAGCKIEQTPVEFIDHRTPAPVEREAAAEQLRDRLLSIGPSIGRGDSGAIVAALAPAPEITGFVAGDPGIHVGAEMVLRELLALADPGPVSIDDVNVRVGPRLDVAWFRLLLRGEERTSGRFSGVFVRFEGEWRLMQFHLSRVVSPDLPPGPPDPAGTPGAVE